MSVRKRRWTDKQGNLREKWMIHVELTLPDGSRKSVRKVSPLQSKRGAERYEREVRQALLDGSWTPPARRRRRHARPAPAPEPSGAPTFADFADEFLTTYVAVNNKHSEQLSKRSIFRNHLLPFFGELRLDQIGAREVERYKAAKLETHANKTINNQLSVLRKTLTTAVEWGLLEQVPTIRWLKVDPPSFRFLDFDDAERLLEGAESEPQWWTMILLAMRTGLRLGELRALKWEDVDLVRGRLLVRRSVSRGVVGATKSYKHRSVPLGPSVVAALKRHRHLRGEWVFCQEDGGMLTKGKCRAPLRRAWKRAGLASVGWHALRHTFASHLVMKGAPMKVVQECLGHGSLEVTMRYAHLSPRSLRSAALILEAGRLVSQPNVAVPRTYMQQ